MLEDNKIEVAYENVDHNGHTFGEYFERTGYTMTFLTSPLEGSDHLTPLRAVDTCASCGIFLSYRRTEAGVTIKSKCEVGEGITTVIDLAVPSGKMIVDDDLRPVYDADMDDLSYNSIAGQAEFTKRMAALGCAYGAVLNTSPSVYRKADGSYSIASLAYADLDEFGDSEDGEEIVPEGWEQLANVCTDLWAYSIADYDDWLFRGGESIEENDNYGCRSVITVEPGIYRFTLHTGEKGFDHHGAGNVIFADFELLK